MPVNKGLLISAAIANGFNAFLDAREKGDLQRQKLALEQVKQQMALTKSNQTYALAQEQERRLQRGVEDTRLYRKGQQEYQLERLAQDRREGDQRDQRDRWDRTTKFLTNLTNKASGLVEDLITETPTEYRKKIDRRSARQQSIAEAQLRELYKNDPNKLAQLEEDLLRKKIGFTAGMQRDWHRETRDDALLAELTEGMTSDQKRMTERLYLIDELDISPENLDGTRQALLAKAKYDGMITANNMSAKKLEEMDYLTVDEAKTLGLAHGTTRKAAWAMGAEPGRYEIKEDKSGALVRIDKWTTDLAQAREVIFQPEAGMTPEMLTFYYREGAKFSNLAISQDYYVMKKQVGRLVNTVAQIPQERAMGGDLGSLVGIDQALVMIYNKLSDETSVVRESEYARTANNLPFISQFQGYWLAKTKEGGSGLTDVERLALARMGMLYAEEAEIAWMGAAASEARKAEALGIKIQPLVGYGFVNVKGERVDTSRWDATRWEAEYEARRDAPQMKITDMVAVMAEDFNLPDASQAELAMIFGRSGLGVSPGTAEAVEEARGG